MDGRNGRYIGVKGRKGYFCLNLSALRYIETCDRNTLLHVGEEKIISSRRMYEYEKQLWDDYFVRCHTSYIVNLNYAYRIGGQDIKLVTGETVPVSRGRRKILLDRMDDFLAIDRRRI